MFVRQRLEKRSNLRLSRHPDLLTLLPKLSNEPNSIHPNLHKAHPLQDFAKMPGMTWDGEGIHFHSDELILTTDRRCELQVAALDPQDSRCEGGF